MEACTNKYCVENDEHWEGCCARFLSNETVTTCNKLRKYLKEIKENNIYQK